MLLHTWAPQALRAAGLQVVETGGWTNRSHGSFPARIDATWHHDASPPGDSPGALNWMISNWNSASANFWVNRKGVWYCVGTGVAWHAGKVAPGMPGSFTSFGVETDQTINETPAPALLDATRRGMAALLKVTGGSLYFHKSVAPARKQDPWLGQSSANRGNWAGELARERATVKAIMAGGGSSAGPTPPEDDLPFTEKQLSEMMYDAARAAVRRELGESATNDPKSALNAGIVKRFELNILAPLKKLVGKA